jgi:Ca-activated chloride channel family protein
MLVSPNPRTASTEVAAKDVVVVMDHSGSMNGEKLRQAKQGVQHVLNHLNAHDRFEVVAYNDSVRTFFGKLVQADANRVGEALARLDAIDATGGTNIHGALTEALKRTASGPRGRPLYVIFLTDGKPTVGQTDTGKIVEEVTSANAADARLFAFGVGYDVNARLLNWLVKDNRGRSEFVKPSEPVESKMSSLYNKIKHPVMTDLAIQLDGVRLTDMYPRNLEDLFDGDQIVLVGRYDGADAARRPTGPDGLHRSTLVIKGTYQGNERAFEYPVGLRTTGRDNRFAFVEKLWAVRRVGYLLEQIQLSGESKEIVDELIRLSKAYGIMTPYTSFLADENQPLADVRRLRGRFLNEKAGRSLARDVSGEAGQRNSANFQQLARAKRAPASASAPGPAADAVASIGTSSREAYEADRAETVAGVRHVGNTALYRRGRQWVASNAAHVDLKKDAEKFVDVERFSDRYFQLVRANTVEQNQVLASQRGDEELVIELRGQVYRIR